MSLEKKDFHRKQKRKKKEVFPTNFLTGAKKDHKEAIQINMVNSLPSFSATCCCTINVVLIKIHS